MRAIGKLPYLFTRTIAHAWRDRVLGLSAEAAFWQMLSLPSLFLALIATLGYVSRWFGAQSVDATENKIESTLSKAFSPSVTDQVIHP
ncbi:MAG: YihY/virulence factor BrkB family protein, partial [Sciscionella sp.]